VHTSVSASAFLLTALLSPSPAVFFSISPLGHPFPSSWLTSTLPLIPRGSSSSSTSHTIQEIPLPINSINSQTFPTPQSCHPSRILLLNLHHLSLLLVLYPPMTNIPRNSLTSPQLQNPTNPAIRNPKLPSSQNSTRKCLLLARPFVPSCLPVSSSLNLTKRFPNSLLERPENHHMIRWDPAGEYIIVEKPEQLALHVLPSVYRQSRFASFSRQLNVRTISQSRALLPLLPTFSFILFSSSSGLP
jgi:hypothetical protein